MIYAISSFETFLNSNEKNMQKIAKYASFDIFLFCSVI